MRNLARLHAAGILCPKPLQLRLHVLGEAAAVFESRCGRLAPMALAPIAEPTPSPPLSPPLCLLSIAVMEFIGENGVAAPRLKDAGLPPSRMRQAYTGAARMLCWGARACRVPVGRTAQRQLVDAHAMDPAQLPLSIAYHASHSSQLSVCFVLAEMLVMLRNLYQKCRLVHADLSGELCYLPHLCQLPCHVLPCQCHVLPCGAGSGWHHAMPHLMCCHTEP